MRRKNFSPEFKRESAQLVVDQNYTVSDAAKATITVFPEAVTADRIQAAIRQAAPDS